MASDLSSGCTEVNELFNDEKEEGEISLEDVSSSEEGQPYKYPPRAFGQCPYCLSTQHCATWCQSLTINKNNVKQDAGLQGKENRSRRHYHKDNSDARVSTDLGMPKSISSYSTLQEKNKNDGTIVINDLVPISSDSDMELVGLGHDTKSEKRSRRPLKSSKTRRRRRNKSPSVTSLSLSPSSIDLALSVKKSIHRLEPPLLTSSKKEIIRSKCYHHSPAKKKLITAKSSLSLHRHNRSRCSPMLPKRRTGRQAPITGQPPRKSSPCRQRETGISLNNSESLQQPSIRGTVTKLLKKVRRLEPFSSRSREKGSSLKEKLSNIINKKEATTTVTTTSIDNAITTTVDTNNQTTTTSNNVNTNTAITCAKETNKETLTKPITKEEAIVSSCKCKEEPIVQNDTETMSKTNKGKDKEEDDDLLVLRQIALETKQKKGTTSKIENIKKETDDSVKTVPQAATLLQKLPNLRNDDNDDDLELRMIALRSAVLKKHHTRMQSGIKRKKKCESLTIPRMESPFTSSFIEDFPLLAKICSPTSPLETKKDIYCDEDMDLDSDMELDRSPYSPTDEVGNGLLNVGVEASTIVNQENALKLNTYLSCKPIDTLLHQDKPVDSLNGNVVEFTSHECRPYSPTDATIYDPELSTVCFNNTETLPLQPPPLPPLPPLDMLTPQQPIMLGCTMNMSNTYTDPLMSLPMSSFPTIHQALNPLLLPPPPPPPINTTSLFTEPVTTTTTSTTSITLASEPTIEPIITNELDDFGETDLDGSPLVSIEHDNEPTTWSLLDEPLYLHNAKKSEPNGLSNLISSVSTTELPSRIIESVSKTIDNSTDETIILPTLCEKGTEVLRSKKLLPVERKRKRRQSNVLRPIKESISVKLNTSREKGQEFNSKMFKEKDREPNAEDDEEVLREILLASLAKRIKDQPLEISSKPVESKNIPKPNDNLSSNTSQSTKLIVSKALVNQLKRPASQNTLVEQPLRKIIKKTSIIPASTRVVNNAKRYQNLLLQRKLNQQKISLITSSKSRFKVNNNSNSNSINKSTGSNNESQRSASPQVTKAISENQRIIINLNEDTESESEAEETKTKFSSPTIRPTLTIPTTDFEKSVDQFLKNVRQQQEMTHMVTTATTNTSTATTITKANTNSKIAPQLKPVQKILTATTTPVEASKKSNSLVAKSSIALMKSSNARVISPITIPTASLGNEKFILTKPKIVKPDVKIPSISATPQAVKHLPVSQQEEYRRLKQQIFEREKLRLQKSKGATVASSAPITLTKGVNILSSPTRLPSTLATSTPKIGLKTRTQTSSSLGSPLRKISPKTQLVATISPMSKQNFGNATGKTTTQVVPTNSKSVINSPSSILKAAIQSNSNSSVSRVHQVKLLDKMNDALHTQKNQIKAVADKVSSLRTLTKEQLDLKSSQLQRAIVESDNRILLDNRNSTSPKNLKDKCKSIFDPRSNSPANLSPILTNEVVLTQNKKEQNSIGKKSTIDTTKQNWENFKEVVNSEVNSLLNISAEKQREILSKTEEELITKRHSVLDDITEMSGSLRQWEIERDLQNMLNSEINKLREQLRMAEEKLHNQKEKLNTIQPKVSVYREKINNGRKECFRLSKICNSLGRQIIGSNYNVPTAGAELLNNKIKEVATHTEKLRSKKNQSNEILKSNNLIKSDKTKIKNNSKSNININSKRKEIIKKQHNLKSTKKNELIIKNNKKNTNLNSENINIKIKTELFEDNFQNLNFIPSNINYIKNKESLTDVDLENSIIKSENDINIKTKKSFTNNNVLNTVLNNVNIYNQELTNQLSKHSDLNTVLKTRNTNSESEKTLKTDLINSNLNTENNTCIDNNKSSTQSNIVDNIKTANSQIESGKKIIKHKVINPTLILNNTDNTITENHASEINTINLNTNIKDVIDLNIKKELIEYRIESSVSNTENIVKIENENSLRMNSENLTLNTTNINSNSNKLFKECCDKLISNQENIVNNESEELIAEISFDNITLTEESENDSKTLNEISASEDIIVENYSITEPKEILDTGISNSISTAIDIVDIELTKSLTENEENDSKLMIIPTYLNTINNENNFNINNINTENSKFNTLVEGITNNSETIQSEVFQNSTSIEHSTQLNQNLLELNNPIKEMGKINEYKVSMEKNYMEQLSDQIGTSDSLMQDCSSKISGQKAIQPYESILKHLHVTRNNKPNGILCPFELMGTCSDGDCQYVHQSTSQCQ